MKKNLWYLIFAVIALLILAGGFWLYRQFNKPVEKKSTHKPVSVKKVNDLELAKRPYVALLPHANPGRCNGVDLIIEDLKNEESLAEYELEYNAGSLIQGVFGRRDFSQIANEHQPLEFGSCSKGKCKCDSDISGGSLTLTFTTPVDEYVLKSDFSLYQVNAQDKLLSTDGRFQVDFKSSLPKGTTVIVMKMMGLPKNLPGELLVGPYGLFTPKGMVAKGKLSALLQTSESSKLVFWDGLDWLELPASQDDKKVNFSMPKLGIVALIKN